MLPMVKEFEVMSLFNAVKVDYDFIPDCYIDDS